MPDFILAVHQAKAVEHRHKMIRGGCSQLSQSMAGSVINDAVEVTMVNFVFDPVIIIGLPLINSGRDQLCNYLNFKKLIYNSKFCKTFVKQKLDVLKYETL